MDFKIFKTQLDILDKTEGDKLRNKYLRKFVNIDHELYLEQIQSKHKFIDGYCYLGYLWDYINEPIIIEEEYLEIIAKSINQVNVFWDIHSSERILIKDYWKFDKDVVLRLSLETLLKGQEFLPDDIYIFDESISWTLIKTHEDIDGKRYCLKSGKI